MKNPRKIVVIIPAFNEAERIAETIRVLRESFMTLEGAECSIFVVDDGSADKTREVAEKAGADRVLSHGTNRGLGAAVRTGLTAARRAQADICVKFDADLQHDPADIPALIQPIVEDVADIVYGNRFARIEYQMPWIRSVGNRVFRQLMRWLTHWPLKDSQPGIFAVANVYLENFSLPGDYNYTQQILLDAYLKGLRFEHVDVAFRPRQTGKSFVSLKYPFKVLPQILMVLIAVRPLRVFVPVGLFFLMIATGVFCTEVVQWLWGPDWLYDKPVRSANLVLGTGLFGLQTLFFGCLAELIVFTRRNL